MKKIAIFTHDAGSSEILISLYRKKKHLYEFKFFCFEKSPCKKILKEDTNYFFLKEGSKIEIFNKLNKFKPDLILYGTSWQIKTHHYFIEYAKESHIKTVCFLDHWTNYKERFNKNFIPDCIATFDFLSTKLAKNLQISKVAQVKNYYFERLQKEFLNNRKKPKNQILFLSEPTAKVAQKRFLDKKYWGFNEIDVFQEVLNFSYKKEMSLILRLHPSDTKDKYTQIKKNLCFSSKSLIDDIAESKLIIGIDTIALYIAYILGKKVIALMPTELRKVTVPIPKYNIVKSLKDLDLSSLKVTNDDLAIDGGLEFENFIKKELLCL